MQSRDPQRLVVVVAHPDDETFGTGSLLAWAADRDMEVTVVCATRGEAGDPAPGTGIEVAELPAVREGELRLAARALGVAEVRVLGWQDSGMDGAPAPGTLCAAAPDEVAEAIGAVLSRARPDVVVTLDGSDGHRDHVAIRDATVVAVDAMADPVSLYLHCLPRSLMLRWMEALQAQDPESSYLHLGTLGTPEHEITTRLDTSHLEGLREAAIAMHRSQVSPYEVMDASLRSAFLTEEHLVRLRPTWDGGQIEKSLSTAVAVAT